MSMWRTTETLPSSVREVAEQLRTIEGIAVPYGQVSADTEFGQEVFAPGAFRESVEHWMGRGDGGKMAYRPAHKEEPVGVVSLLRDMPEGVRFQAQIEDSPEGDKYLRRVRAGLNGVSVEAGLPRDSKRVRDLMVHRTARLFAIAGSISPAYDGARIALRDLEEVPMDEKETPKPEPQPEPQPKPEPVQRDAATVTPQLSQAERSAQEAATVAGIRPIARVTLAEAIYGPRSAHSYFADMLHANEGNGAAAERQHRHAQLLSDQAKIVEAFIAERAGDVLPSEIPGAYPNQYLPGLLTPRILKGRPMGGFFNRVPITDATPKIFPKVTTSLSVAVQSAPGANPAASDLATTAVTATPLLYGGHTAVARQVLDGGDPSADAMIMQDLLEAYAQASEAVVVTAVEAGATASGTPITAATPFAGLVGNIIKYQTTRFTPAEGQFIPGALYAVAMAQNDTSGRPLIPWLNPANADAQVEAGAAAAVILGAGDYLSWGSTVNVVVTARRNDYVMYESSIAQFRYDQTLGPAAIDLGIWAYLVVGTRLGGLSVTAA